MGVAKGSRDLLMKFWDPPHISGMVGARNFKFRKQIDHQENETNAKLTQRGSERFNISLHKLCIIKINLCIFECQIVYL